MIFIVSFSQLQAIASSKQQALLDFEAENKPTQAAVQEQKQNYTNYFSAKIIQFIIQ